MANPEHVEKLMEGVEAWNAWREEHSDIVPDLTQAYFVRENLTEANLSGAHLDEANLKEADLRGSNLIGTELSKADLREANLGGAILILADASEANLVYAKLEGTNLNGANLSYAYLREADLNGADLREANLRGSDLTGADLTGADLREAVLKEANLLEVNLRDVYLTGVDLSRADLNGVNFSSSFISRTVFGSVDFSTAKGLDTIIHLGPSILDVRSIPQAWLLPKVFLQGCGLQDWEIEAAKLHDPDLSPTEIADVVYEIDRFRSENPIQIHNLFISYSHADSDFVDRLEPYFDERGIRSLTLYHGWPGGADHTATD